MTSLMLLRAICFALAMTLAGLGGPAWAAGTVDVSPREAERPLTFEDWCRGIKSYPAERCAQRHEEDLEAFEEVREGLAEIRDEDAAPPTDDFDIDFGTCDDDITPVWDEEDCGPITEPGPSIQPVPRGIP